MKIKNSYLYFRKIKIKNIKTNKIVIYSSRGKIITYFFIYFFYNQVKNSDWRYILKEKLLKTLRLELKLDWDWNHISYHIAMLMRNI